MRTVRDGDGTRYLLVTESGESSRVRNPRTGEERYLPNDELETVDGASPLEAAACGVPSSTRTALSAVRDDRSLGLLIEVVDDGPLSVTELLDGYDLCESDLHGLIAEFRAAGLVTEADVAGRRGYAATETAEEAVAHLRSNVDSSGNTER